MQEREREREREIDSHFRMREKEPREKRREGTSEFWAIIQGSYCWNFEIGK